MTKMFPTLYKINSRGKIQTWTISCCLTEGVGRYTVTHGQQNGKMQTTSTKVLAGKNVGKKNETSIWEQTVADAQSLWNKQRDRKGYSETIPTDRPFSPMLAKEYKKESKHIVFPCAVQPKLDGIRCIARVTANPFSVKFMSRQGAEFKVLQHLEKEFKAANFEEDVVLDGELYVHGWDFQDIVSAVKRDEPTDKTSEVEYHVYDVVDTTKSFRDRITYLWNIQLFNLIKTLDPYEENTPHIKIVQTENAPSKEEVVKLFESKLSEGYEGVIVRNLHGLYETKRSKHLQKYKDFQDDEFEIVDVRPGQGKFEMMGIVVLKTPMGKEFEATPKGDEAYRRSVLADKSTYIGKTGTVQYFGWTTSDEPVPRFPIFKGLRYES